MDRTLAIIGLVLDLLLTAATAAGLYLGRRAWGAGIAAVIGLLISGAICALRFEEIYMPDDIKKVPAPLWRPLAGAAGKVWLAAQALCLMGYGLGAGAVMSTVHVSLSAPPDVGHIVPGAIVLAAVVAAAHYLLPSGRTKATMSGRITAAAHVVLAAGVAAVLVVAH